MATCPINSKEPEIHGGWERTAERGQGEWEKGHGPTHNPSEMGSRFCGHRWVSLGLVLGCVAKAKHIPVELKERPSDPYGLVPMSLAL